MLEFFVYFNLILKFSKGKQTVIDIKGLQYALKRKGFKPGKIDGFDGLKTQCAIIRFKDSINRLDDLHIEPDLLDLLMPNENTLGVFSQCGRNEQKVWPHWLKTAHSYLGLRELPGAKHNPKILEWWSKIRAPFSDDETPWCAAFVGGVLEESKIRSSKSASARSYQYWDFPLAGPSVGAIAVFWRNKKKGWKGHVGFIVGRNVNNDLMILGGNQGDKVSILPFPTKRVLSYRWPMMVSLPKSSTLRNLPILDSNGKLSTNES